MVVIGVRGIGNEGTGGRGQAADLNFKVSDQLGLVETSVGLS